MKSAKVYKGNSKGLVPSGKQIPKGKGHGVSGPAAGSGLAGRKMIANGVSNQKGKISQAGGKKKGPLEAIAFGKIMKGQGGYK